MYKKDVYFTILEPTTNHNMIDRIEPATNPFPADNNDLSIKK
jgi:hypothetical protein